MSISFEKRPPIWEIEYESLDQELKSLEELQTKFYSYYLWQRMATCNVKIQELKPNYYFNAYKFIQEYYIPNDPLCDRLNLQDDSESIRSLKCRILRILKDSTSLVAIDEGRCDDIAGVMILVEVNKIMFNRIRSQESFVSGKSYKKIIRLTENLNNLVDIYDTFNCDVFLRVYLLCVKQLYRNRGLGKGLFSTAIRIAQNLNIPVIMGVFADRITRTLAHKFGMEEVASIPYSNWGHDKYGECIFANLKYGQDKCAIMAGRVPPPPKPAFISSHALPTPEENKKKTKRKK